MTAIDAGLVGMAADDMQYGWTLAQCYALVGESKPALEWLESAINAGFRNYPMLAEWDPLLEAIRAEDGFRQLLERVKTLWQSFEV